MKGITFYTAERIFTGDTWLEDSAIAVKEGKVEDILPVSHLPGDAERIDHPGSYLAPAFIDLQIYGANGRLLAVYPDADSLRVLNDYCNRGGAAWCMPTVATNTYDVFHRSIDAIRAYWANGGKGIWGLHIEGPWINPVKRGAHIESLVHTPTVQQVKALLDYGKDVIRIITLAPEICSPEVIALILSHDIVISAGHSNATYAEANKGFELGITTVTHLFNAMSPLQHREPGLAGAVLDHATVRSSIIPDGHHVDYAAIRIAKKAMGDRLFVITDAVTDTDRGYYPHERAGDKYISSGILSGSALDMAKAVQNLVKFSGIDLAEALRMCSLYPARVMNADHRLGKIARGYEAAIVALDEQGQVSTLYCP